jgi:hypothetical protein
VRVFIRRCLPSRLPPLKVEHEHVRSGVWAYLAALRVPHFKLLGSCEPAMGIVPEFMPPLCPCCEIFRCLCDFPDGVVASFLVVVSAEEAPIHF